ncbi:MAG: hypothetical protein CMH55_10720 [Myxococcales bacterium]|nr:hypothetical protein [Myxococcales bacterium]
MAPTVHLIHNGKKLPLQLQVARTFLSRSWGWLGRRRLAPNEALWIEPCSRVHSFFMGIPIAVVMLDREGQVLSIRDPLNPWHLGPRGVFGGAALELAPGAVARFGIGPGDRLTLKASSR